MEWLSTYGSVIASILTLSFGLGATALLGWLGYHRLRWRVDGMKEDLDVLKKEIKYIKDTRPSHEDLTAAVARVEVYVNDLRDNFGKMFERIDRVYELLAHTQSVDRRRCD